MFTSHVAVVESLRYATSIWAGQMRKNYACKIFLHHETYILIYMIYLVLFFFASVALLV